MKKGRIIGIGIVLVVVILGVWTFWGHAHQQKDEITLGTIGSDAKIWNYIAKQPATKKAHIKLQVKSFTDGVALNTATAQGKVNVNAFQSDAYLQAYNQKNPKQQLDVIGTTYLEPLGIYSTKYKQLNQIPDGSTIAIADNPANTARGLKLLAQAGLIKLKPNFSTLSGLNGIASNPHQFKFQEIDDTTGPRVIKDQKVAAALISNTIALEGHLNVLTDSLYHEQVNQSTKANINVLATAKNASKQQKHQYKKLLQIYHSKTVQKYVQREFDGTKIEVQKPVSYLRN
ncbi:MetQ/NlpA family ABC transporter substrate-binding protein [Fructilactobacillus carniphilus]|uniref:MetQ/NlpA family ABC transporter substrate-binding protein n=1 Tax=Fructilactobacillus carniphilus TaxID=2940297 RepID=A0ABY5BWH2_9LACO|nr:MetQ/NlpA family ABC transporter substrate-binding protein [Fructilactobacillus carniphilus]USS90846.1 MetQ/NlpA family ABC transporter substrate-binding protein [Fructilactobacillus carniphilus]